MQTLFKKEVKDDPNPWLKIKHPHIWLEANNGEERVCGDCGLRRKANEMFEEEVKTKNGVTKRVVAGSQEELDEAVKAVKNEQSPVAPDINDPKDGNKIVSPDNKHTEAPYVQPVQEVPEEETPKPSPKKK